MHFLHKQVGGQVEAGGGLLDKSGGRGCTSCISRCVRKLRRRTPGCCSGGEWVLGAGGKGTGAPQRSGVSHSACLFRLFRLEISRYRESKIGVLI